MAPQNLWTRIRGRYIRDAARLFFKRPFRINSPVPLISFTFDDFPRSALHTGGAILKRFGVRGTYYASFGLMGKQAPTGEMFLSEDVKTLLQEGHELGCHTFAHCDAWETRTSVFEASIRENQSALDKLVPGASFKTFSYPISPPRMWTKRRISQYFVCGRGGGQTFNLGTADLNYLRAFFLEKNRDCPEVVKNLIDQNRQERGWLIFATHDICENPTPWGCTPAFFADVVQSAVNSGARILPVIQACQELRSVSLLRKSETL
jgi:peptidoglycan/xylan/chitin deacetylase (PgdA/CDA1 family)